MKFLALGLLLLCAPGALLDFAAREWKRDRHVEMDDAYKWLFQATRGGEHAVPDEAMARQWLEREWLSLGPAEKDEPVWQPLCKDDSIGRLNLRPFKTSGGRAEAVLAAFVQSSKNFDQSKEDFLAAWEGLGKRLKKKPLGKLTGREWKKLDDTMKAKSYPAVHHSKNYGAARAPAYRVITGSEYQALRKSMKHRP